MTTLKGLCKKYELEAAPEFWQAPENAIQDIFNGAGPDWLPKWGRDILSQLLRLYQGAFIVHDFDFAIADKTEEGFKKANERMWKNMKKILNKEYPLSKWSLWHRRAQWHWRAFAAYRACVRCGWPAWLTD